MASLLGKSADELHRDLTKAGITVESYFSRPAVNWKVLRSQPAAKILQKLKVAAKRRHFDLERSNWTVASFPTVLALWDSKRNQGTNPAEVIYRSEEPFYWKCTAARGHVWQGPARIRFHTERQADGLYAVLGCPFCSHHRVTIQDSLAKKRPDIAREWHPTRNGSLQPEQVALKSKKKVWWKCAEGHVWQRLVSVRTASISGCPYCSGRKLTRSNSLAAMAPKVAAQWHPVKNGTLRPRDVLCTSTTPRWWKCKAAPDHEWQAATAARVKGSVCPCCINRKTTSDNTLAHRYPEIAREWHPKRNGALRPEDVVATAGLRVWWKCDKGPDHEWCCRVLNRTQNHTGCPCCSGHKISVTNSLASLFPRVAKEWNAAKNQGRKASAVNATSAQKCWWRCSQGHQWQAAIFSRTVYSHGCPDCEAKAGITRHRRRQR